MKNQLTNRWYANWQDISHIESRAVELKTTTTTPTFRTRLALFVCCCCCCCCYVDETWIEVFCFESFALYSIVNPSHTLWLLPLSNLHNHLSVLFLFFIYQIDRYLYPSNMHSIFHRLIQMNIRKKTFENRIVFFLLSIRKPFICGFFSFRVSTKFLK